jgi:hypothetical protein
VERWGFVVRRFALEKNKVNSDLQKPFTKGDFLLAQVKTKVGIWKALRFIFFCLAIGFAIKAVYVFFTDADLSNLVSKAVLPIIFFVCYTMCLIGNSNARKEQERIQNEMAGLD